MPAINPAYTDKFDYPETEAITIEGIGRLYETPHGFLPSVTTILSKTKVNEGLKAWREAVGEEKADRITREAGDKGTQVHDLMELYLKGLDYKEKLKGASDKVRSGFNSLKIYQRHITEIWGQEVFLYDKELQIAGRVDLVGMYDGVLSIVDWKTSRRPKKPEWIIDYKLQTLTYKLMHDSMFGTDIKQGVILIAVENDMPQKFVIDFYAEENDWLWEELAERVSDFADGGYLEQIKEVAGV